MDVIINFYKELDVLNLILFWGIIIVITLLLLFAIVISQKNKKLRQLIREKEKIENNDLIPIKDNVQYEISKNNKFNEKFKDTIKDEKKFQEDGKFIAEEYVMEYNPKNDIEKKQNKNINIEKIDEKLNSISGDFELNKKDNMAYKKNILKQLSSNQTSPIGIIKSTEKSSRKSNEMSFSVKSNDLEPKKENQIQSDNSNETSNNNVKKSDDSINHQKIRQVLSNYNNLSRENIKKTEQYEKNQNNFNYLNELSKAIEDEKQKTVNRTDYEIEQEKEAIISYKELMEKKDELKIVDEEDAVISIEELLNRETTNTLNKDTSEDDKFIEELKKFRKGLH